MTHLSVLEAATEKFRCHLYDFEKYYAQSLLMLHTPRIHIVEFSGAEKLRHNHLRPMSTRTRTLNRSAMATDFSQYRDYTYQSRNFCYHRQCEPYPSLYEFVCWSVSDY